MELKSFQKSAVDATINAIKKGKSRVLLSMPIGVGKSSIIFGLIAELPLISYEKKNIFVIFTHKYLCSQFAEEFHNNCSNYLADGVTVTYSYHNMQNNVRAEDLREIDYVICVDSSVPNISHFKSDTIFIGFTVNKSARKGIFKDAECVFDYSLEQSISEGVIRAAFRPQLYGLAYEGFCKRLLEFLLDASCNNNVANEHDRGYDFLFERAGERILVECKLYRDKNISFYKTEQSVWKLCNSGLNSDIKLLLIMGLVSEADKELIYKKYNVTVWDIANFLFYANDNADLLNDIKNLAFYPIADVAPQKSIGWGPEGNKNSIQHNNIGKKNFVARLKTCKSGEANFREYEDLCADIINYLFDGEFSKIKRQHKSIDELFRMDMICALKGTSEFWLMLEQHYNSKFVVFEFKNYSAELDQNIIYVTEKYLFNAALRNVAIIISRKGFSDNAKIAADGCIKENGKLIIDITDEDLIKMIKIKEDGEEPADYLLLLLEDRLMAIGK